MAPPVAGAELQQFIGAVQWLDQGKPNFDELVSSLQDIMESVYVAAGNPTKRSVSRARFASLKSSDIQMQCFGSCKLALSNQLVLSHLNPAQRLCVSTDASDSFGQKI